MFFLSSPVPAPPTQSSPFFSSSVKPYSSRSTWTSSHTRETSYAQAYNKAYYAPYSPSPLRTERNANIMSSPTRSTGLKTMNGSLLSSSPVRGGMEDVEDVENWIGIEGEVFGFHNAIVQSTPVGKMNTAAGMGGYGFDGEGSNLTTPPASGSQPPQKHNNTTHSSPLALTSQQSTSARPSQWSLRSRESSPSSLLTTQTTRNREERKSKFLDRIRRRRDDERSAIVGDQVLRMDFVKQRRGWEEQMARRAALEPLADLDEEEEEEDGAPEVEDEGMSPTEEYDDLVREFERIRRVDEEGDEFVVDEVEEEEYERLFREMEILSQQSQSQSQAQSQMLDEGKSQSQPEPNPTSWQPRQPQQTDEGGGDDAMDIS